MLNILIDDVGTGKTNMRRIIVIACALLLTGCGAPEQTQTINVPTLRYGLIEDPATFDPHITGTPEVGVVLRQVYDTLLYRDPSNLAIVPGLATDWTVSEDGLAYTFRLQQGVTFHDNTPFNAQAVAANIDRILEVGQGGRALELLSAYGSYEILDDYTILIRLNEPDASFLDALTQVELGMASPAAFQNYSTQRYQFYQVGTGPFRFVDFIPGTHVVLERNPGYSWGPSFYSAPTDNPVRRVEFQFLTRAAERSAGLLANEIDVVGGLLPADARELAVNPQLQILPLTMPGQPIQFLMNAAQFPTDDPVVRQVLILATNRADIANDVLQGFSRVAWSPLSSATLFYSASFAGSYEYDVVQARSLLESAGFTDSDDDGLLDVGGEPLTIRVVILRDDITPLIAERLRAQWLDIGVRMEVTVAPTETILQTILSDGEYNLVGTRQNAIEPVFLEEDYGENGLTNISEAEALFADLQTAETNSDISARAAAYVGAQNTIMQEALLLPVADPVNLIGTSTRVSSFAMHANAREPILPNMVYAPG